MDKMNGAMGLALRIANITSQENKHLDRITLPWGGARDSEGPRKFKGLNSTESRNGVYLYLVQV